MSPYLIPLSLKARLLFLSLLIMGLGRGAAQDTILHMRKNGTYYTRNDYVENLTSYINITPFIYSSSNSFSIKGKLNVRYKPNEGNNIGVRLNHRWIGFALTYSPKQSQESNKGQTDFLNLQLSGYGKKIGFDIYYNTYTGFYIENYELFDELRVRYGKGNFPVRPDLSTTSMGFNGYYIFNHKRFSYRASFIQNEWQKKSAASFLLNGSFSYYHLKADSSIVPNIIDAGISRGSHIREGTFYSFSVLPGFGFTLVALKHLYFTLSPHIGVTMQLQRFSADSLSGGTADEFVLAPRSLNRSSMGYNSRRFYVGISGTLDVYNIPVGKGETLSYEIGNAFLFIGYRFGVPPVAKPASQYIGELPARIFRQQ